MVVVSWLMPFYAPVASREISSDQSFSLLACDHNWGKFEGRKLLVFFDEEFLFTNTSDDLLPLHFISHSWLLLPVSDFSFLWGFICELWCFDVVKRWELLQLLRWNLSKVFLVRFWCENSKITIISSKKFHNF